MPLPTLRERERENHVFRLKKEEVFTLVVGGERNTCWRGALYLPGAMGSNTSDNSGIIPPRPLIYYRYFFLLFLKEFKGWISTQITQTKAPLIHNAALREMLLLSRGHPEGRRAQMNPLRGGGGRRKRGKNDKQRQSVRLSRVGGTDGRTERAKIQQDAQSTGRPRSDALIEEAAAV